MKTFKDIRENIIKSFIARELLDETIYPSLEMICAIFIDEYKDVDANSSFIKDRMFVEDGQVASLTWFNELVDKTQLDIITIYAFVDYLYDYTIKSNTLAKNKISSLLTSIKLLYSDIRQIELAKSTVGVNVVLSDSFTNGDNIDPDNSDANIDFNTGCVSSKRIYDITRIVDNSKILSISQASVTQGYINFGSPIANQPESLLFSGGKWIAEYNMPVGFSNNIEVKLSILLTEQTYVNKINLTIENINGAYIKVMALVDGIYKIVKDYAIYNGAADVSFDTISTNNILLFFKTDKNLSIDNTSTVGKYYKIVGSNLQLSYFTYASKSILTTEEVISNTPFSNIMLTTNQTDAENSSIDYFVSWYSNSVWSAWAPISPYNSIDGTGTIIDVLSSPAQIFLDQTDGNVDFGSDLDVTHPYIYGYNYATNYTEDSLNFISVIQPKLLRNLGSCKVSDNIGECWIAVAQDGVAIDFSVCKGYIDSEFIDNKTTLNKGVYNFKFNVNDGIDNYTAYLLSIDNIYIGTHLSSFISPELYINIVEDNDLNKFTFVNIGGAPTAIFKNDSINILTEKFLVIKYDIDSNDLNSLPTKLQLMAKFNSDNINTSKLYDMQIKVI